MGMTYLTAARLRLLAVPVAAALAVCAMPAQGAWAATGTVLYSFTGGADGATPQGALVADSAGNLYGTTTEGGASGQGTIYKLTRDGSGWTKTTLYSFSGASGGYSPEDPLVFDGSGNLYGTTYYGGPHGAGVVFELSPSGSTWTYSVLYGFTGSTDGGYPADGVVLRNGNLYGTTSQNGADGQGNVFQLTRTGSTWTETVLHQFVANGVDGRFPGGRGAVVFDGSGNLYGVTVAGGPADAGVVYELAAGTWTETILYSFTGGTDGANPLGTLLRDSSGAIYGTASSGGSAGDGVVYKLTRSGSSWAQSVLYAFPGGASGRYPYAGVISDSAGNLYGDTTAGVQGGGGVVFKLTPSGSTWTQSVLYTVGGAGDGCWGSLIRDSAGNLYGTDNTGGPAGAGQVFEVTP